MKPDLAAITKQSRSVAGCIAAYLHGHYPGGKALGHGKGYLYPHDFPGHYVEQQYLPDGVQGTPFYEPTEEGTEAKLKRRMEARRLLPEN